MQIRELLDSIKEKTSLLAQKIKEYYELNKVISLVIVSLVFVIFICIILLTCSIKKDRNKEVETKDEIVLTQTPVIPQNPSLSKDYNIARKTEREWSEEEIEEWFTIPSQKEIDSLSRTNENIINEITGAAP